MHARMSCVDISPHVYYELSNCWLVLAEVEVQPSFGSMRSFTVLLLLLLYSCCSAVLLLLLLLLPLLLLLLQFFKEYDKILNQYMGMGDDGIGLDLTLVRHMMPPPAAAAARHACRGTHGKATNDRQTFYSQPAHSASRQAAELEHSAGSHAWLAVSHKYRIPS
jgi:hypothetical protein